MKIWFLTGEFAPEFGGGIGTYVENCAKMFAEAGHDITVIVRGNNETNIETTKEGYKVLRFKTGNKEYYDFLGYENALAYQYYEEIIELIKKEGKPDLIETQEYDAFGQYLIQNKKLFKEELSDVPIVVHLHTPFFETNRVNQYTIYKQPYYWIGEMEKFCMKGADALLCPSQFLADVLQPIVPDKKIKVINLPFHIDEEELKKYEALETTKPEKKTIMYFGRTEYRKGIVQFLAEARKLWDKGIDFKVKIVGGDTILESTGRSVAEDLNKKYKDIIKKGNLEMIPSIPHLELIPHILSSTILTVPSLYENFPNTCIYSMWLGKPMLVSKSGGQAEMVQESGRNGIIFDWDKEGDLEEKLEMMLNMSDEELKRLGNNAKQRINELCNMEDNLKKREEFFKNVIQENKGKGIDKEFPFINSDIKKTDCELDYEGQKDLLSVVIPYYNLGDTLPETIESIKQTEYKNYEIVIINDGSTDENSKKVLDNYRNDSSIRVIDIKNKGLANARNIGAKEAKGEFIAFLDADDKIDKTFYPRAVEILKYYNNVSYVYSWVQYFEGSKGVWPTFNIHLPYLLCANMLAAFVVIKKNDFLNFGQNKLDMEYGMEDYDSWISLAENGCFGVAIPEKLNIYRVRKNSMARQFNKGMRIYLYQKMSQHHKELYSKYAQEVFMLLNTNGQSYYWNNPTTLIYDPHDDENISLDPEDQRMKELKRMVNSRFGNFCVRVFFKLKLNKLFR